VSPDFTSTRDSITSSCGGGVPGLVRASINVEAVMPGIDTEPDHS
jgi:hypothetical protein